MHEMVEGRTLEPGREQSDQNVSVSVARPRNMISGVSAPRLDTFANQPTFILFFLNKQLHHVIQCITTLTEALMLAIRLEKDLEKEIDLLAKTKGSNRSAVVREAIVRYLEDNEDLELAKQALAETSSSKSLKDLRKDLGLDS